MKNIIKILSIAFVFSIFFKYNVSNQKNITVNANSQEDEIIRYLVTWDLNGGKYFKSEIVEEYYIDGSLIEPLDEDNMHRDTASFSHWETPDGVIWNFETDIITSDLELRAIWNWEEDELIYIGGNSSYNYGTLTEYINNKYYSNEEFSLITENTVDKFSAKKPIEMFAEFFSRKEVYDAKSELGIDKEHPGCGPVAMMGILYYLSDAMGYGEIISDVSDSLQRINLAKDVLGEVNTTEINIFGNKQTYTDPGDYNTAFNNLMKQYYLDNNIQSSKVGTWNSYDEKIQYIKNSIDNGIPVTMYNLLYTGNEVSGHYVNVYGYCDYIIVDRDGNIIENTFLFIRVNFGLENHIDSYADADILDRITTGLIIYDINYEHDINLKASEFAEEFINTSTGEGQYFFYSKEQTIVNPIGYIFDTKRLRCSYIEDQYLVLSANRINAGLAYLEFSLTHKIKKLTFDMSLWSNNEYLSELDGDKLTIQIYDKTSDTYVWKDYITFDLNGLSTSKTSMDAFIIFFPDNVSEFRFKITDTSPTSDRNKGRIVLENIHLYFDEDYEIHYHSYDFTTTETHHYGVCDCGAALEEPHVFNTSTSYLGYVVCINCSYKKES